MTFAAGTSTVTPAGWQITGQLAARGTSVPLSGPATVTATLTLATAP